MNVILLVTDSFRKDHLGCYGNKWIHTPHLDRFSKRAMRFTNYYPVNFPTVPNRYDLMTGRHTFTYARWEPLQEGEVVLPEMLGANGYKSMMIADTPHCLAPGMNFQKGFDGWELIRGQEGDKFWIEDRDVEMPAKETKLRTRRRTMTQHTYNSSLWRSEEDTFCAQTLRRAATWLEKNSRQDKFFLSIDTFDPHEPWIAPQPYVDLYDKNYKGEKVLFPLYGKADYMTKREMKHMRAQYAAECTLVDRWIGHLFATVESLDLFKNTAIIVTADHGFLLGEHGLTGKLQIDIDNPNIRKSFHLYDHLIFAPLLVSLPNGKGAGRTTKAMCSTPDITATILEMTGTKPHPRVQGESLMPVLTGKTDKHRSFTCSAVAFPPRPELGGSPVGTAVFNDGRYTYLYGGMDQPHELYDLKKNPDQKKNLIRTDKARAIRMHKRFIKWCEELKCPEEYLELRRDPGL